MLEAEISDHPDVIAIQETWLNNSHSDEDLKIDGYTIVRSDRVGRIGGGVAMYLSDRVGWSSPIIPTIEGVEYICVVCQIGHKKSRICNIYRPDSPVSWLDKFQLLLEFMSDINFDLIVVGDFNIDFLNQTSSKSLKNLLNSYDVTQHVELPTRSTANSSSCIDVFITRNSNS